MREFLKRHKQSIYLWLFLILPIFAIALIINTYPSLYNYIHTKSSGDATPEIYSWFYFISGAGTAALALIAWLKIGHIEKENEGNFLLHIDERWGSRQSIKARAIIHGFYMQVKTENETTIGNLTSSLGACETFIQIKIGEKIIAYGKELDKNEDFIYLLNFLDFMETIGYLESKGFVTADELEALCGEALRFNYKIFKPYIEDKRNRHQNDGFYVSFDKLFGKLKEKSWSLT